ncbi:MAG: 6-bladed beta-propeller, partial [Gemmatimonadales bacterium]
ITVFDAQGNYLRSVGGPEHLLNPVDVAVDPIDGRIHVADSHLHQIVTFSSDGELLGRLGVTDALPADVRERHARAEDSNEPRGPIDAYQNRSGEPGEFRFPLSLAVTRDGTLYVSDGLNFRVQVFDRFGNYVRQIGELGDGPGSFARPKGIAVDSYGHLYVADASFNNVQVFDAEGNLLLAFAEGGQGEGQILLPLGLSLDAQDRIWIADRFNNRTQVFQYIAGSEGGGAIATEDVVTTAGEPAGSR